MKNLITITKGAQINAGNFIVSIGSFNTAHVAIISKSSGNFVKLQQAKKSKKLRQVKRKFKSWINNDDTFNFDHMGDDMATQLIMMLRK